MNWKYWYWNNVNDLVEWVEGEGDKRRGNKDIIELVFWKWWNFYKFCLINICKGMVRGIERVNLVFC